MLEIFRMVKGILGCKNHRPASLLKTGLDIYSGIQRQIRYFQKAFNEIPIHEIFSRSLLSLPTPSRVFFFLFNSIL